MTVMLWSDEAKGEVQRPPSPVVAGIAVLIFWAATLVGAFFAGLQLHYETQIQYVQETMRAQTAFDSLGVRADRILRDAAVANAMTLATQDLLHDLIVYRDAMNQDARDVTASLP